MYRSQAEADSHQKTYAGHFFRVAQKRVLDGGVAGIRVWLGLGSLREGCWIGGGGTIDITPLREWVNIGINP